MSSLAAARADNFYFDPERFDPKKRGRDGYNALANSHPLGERAKRLKSEGILIIRFEMPLDAWCLRCNEHCARGVRFNAEKKKTGNYFSTPIYEFRMTCPSCSNEFVIKTDPQNSDYIYESGLRKKVREYSSSANETLKLTTAEVRERLATDPIFKLEHQADDKRKAKSEEQRLADIAEGQELRYGDRLSSNAAARAAHRIGRHEYRAQLAEGAAVGLAAGVPLLPETREDAEIAAAMIGSRDTSAFSDAEYTSAYNSASASSSAVLSASQRSALLSSSALPNRATATSSAASSTSPAAHRLHGPALMDGSASVSSSTLGATSAAASASAVLALAPRRREHPALQHHQHQHQQLHKRSVSAGHARRLQPQQQLGITATDSVSASHEQVSSQRPLLPFERPKSIAGIVSAGVVRMAGVESSIRQRALSATPFGRASMAAVNSGTGRDRALAITDGSGGRAGSTHHAASSNSSSASGSARPGLAVTLGTGPVSAADASQTAQRLGLGSLRFPSVGGSGNAAGAGTRGRSQSSLATPSASASSTSAAASATAIVRQRR